MLQPEKIILINALIFIKLMPTNDGAMLYVLVEDIRFNPYNFQVSSYSDNLS